KNRRIRCVVFIIDCEKGSVKLEMADTAVNFSAFIRTAAGRACGCFRFRPLSRSLIPFRFSSGKSSFLPFPQETALEGVFAHLHQFDPVSVGIMRPALPVSVASLTDSGIQRRSRFFDPLCRLMDILHLQAQMGIADV